MNETKHMSDKEFADKLFLAITGSIIPPEDVQPRESPFELLGIGGENMENPTTMYSIETPENFRYRVVLWSTMYHLDNRFWYVHDTKRNTFRKIGRVQLRGVNYFDRAIEFCKNKQEVKI